MTPEDYERQDIEVLNEVAPYCFESDREEQWFKVGLQYGLDAADKEPLIHWISVKDDLPCNHEELISSEDKRNTFYVIALVHGFVVLNRMEKIEGEWHWTTDEPSHWFAIPELPKE